MATNRHLEEVWYNISAKQLAQQSQGLDRHEKSDNRGYTMVRSNLSYAPRRSIYEYADSVKKIIYGPEILETGDDHFSKKMNKTGSILPFRLAKNVTGCMLVPAHKSPVGDALLEMHNKQLISKVFLAVVLGRPEKKEGIIDIPIKQSRVYQFNSNKRNERSVLDHQHSKSKYVPDEEEHSAWKKMRAKIEEMKVRGDRRLDVDDRNSGNSDMSTGSSTSSQYWGQRAVTYYKLLSYSHETNTSVLQVQPLTHVQNQIEVHLADGLGTPILGDHKHCSDGNARGGMSRSYNKYWYSKAFTQPLPVQVFKAMKFPHPVTTFHLPLHLHLSKIYVPGMAGDRTKIDHSEEGYANLAEKMKEANEKDFILNNGSDLLCEAPIPDFWHLTLRRLNHPWIEKISSYMVSPRPPRLLERSLKDTDGNSDKISFKLNGMTYFNRGLDGRLSAEININNKVKYAAGHKSKYFEKEQSDRAKLLGSRLKGNPVRLKGQQRQMLFEKMLEEKIKEEEREERRLGLKMDDSITRSNIPNVQEESSRERGLSDFGFRKQIQYNLAEEEKYSQERYERIRKRNDKIRESVRPRFGEDEERFDLSYADYLPGRNIKGQTSESGRKIDTDRELTSSFNLF